MGWRGYIDDTRKVVFFWSQKAACTTLFNILADNIPERPTHKKFFHTHSQPHQICLKAIQQQGYQSVILARHPVTRVISAYFNKFCLYNGTQLRSRADLEPFAQALHDRFCDRLGIRTQNNVMHFGQFLDTIADLHAARPSPTTPVNGHWDTQVPPFLAKRAMSGAGFAYDHVLHVENFEPEMTALATQLDLTFQPRAMNRTKVTEQGHTGSLVQMQARHVADHAFGYRNFITPQTLAQIADIYAPDFALFGYPPAPKGYAPKAQS